MSAIFDIIRIPFGFVIRWIHSWSHSYLLAIFLFAILIKLVLFPLGIKQQKNSQQQASLRPKENVIRKKYAGRNDRVTQMKMTQEIQDLYQKENYSPFSGCLPMFFSMLVLLAVYGIVRAPLTYTAALPQLEEGNKAADTVKQTVAYMVYEGEIDGKVADYIRFSGSEEELTEEKFYESLHAGNYNFYAEINAANAVLDDPDAFTEYLLSHNDRLLGASEAENCALIRQAIDAVPNMEVFPGFNLGENPSLGSLTSSEASLGQKLLLLIPVITVITAYFGQALTRKFTYQPETTPEQASQMRMMNIFMPLFSLYLSFVVPAAVAVYWVIQNVTSPLQQIALAAMFPIKEITPEEMREAERLYGGKTVKKKGNTATASSNNATPGKKKKSLVYDDDEEYENIGRVEPKKALQEKKEEKDGLVDKAPLKDENQD